MVYTHMVENRDLTSSGRVRREKSRSRHECILWSELKAVTKESNWCCIGHFYHQRLTIDIEMIPI